MTVVDVNTGKFTGSGGNLEETVTKNNLEAAEEIVRQLRLRDIGGIIVIDFIDMVLESNRDLVLRRLVECLGRDRTKHQVAEVTSLGLVQMTRKRIGTGLLEAFSETCEHCHGRGVIIARRAGRAQARTTTDVRGGARRSPPRRPTRRRQGAATAATARRADADGRGRRWPRPSRPPTTDAPARRARAPPTQPRPTPSKRTSDRGRPRGHGAGAEPSPRADRRPEPEPTEPSLRRRRPRRSTRPVAAARRPTGPPAPARRGDVERGRALAEPGLVAPGVGSSEPDAGHVRDRRS